jgi:hypothetical protein
VERGASDRASGSDRRERHVSGEAAGSERYIRRSDCVTAPPRRYSEGGKAALAASEVRAFWRFRL